MRRNLHRRRVENLQRGLSIECGGIYTGGGWRTYNGVYGESEKETEREKVSRDLSNISLETDR